MKTVVITPTYNEKENIGPLIEEVQRVFKTVKGHQMSILVVDDNSPDGTGDVVKEKQKKYKNLHIITGNKEGLGQAYLRGMKYASEKLGAEVMFEMDADFQHDPKLIPNFMAKIDQGYDLVIGSRYIPGGSIPSNWGLDRKIYSVLGNFVVRAMLFNFGHRDWTTGYRALRTPVYKKVRSELGAYKGYTFQVCFLHKAFLAGAKVTEVPMQFLERIKGESKIGSASYIYNLIRYLIVSDLTNPPRQIRFILVGGTAFVTQATLFAIFKSLFASEIANAIGFTAAVTFNFFANNFWTFSDRAKKINLAIIPEYFKFFAISALGGLTIQTTAIYSTKLILGPSQVADWLGFILGVGIGLFVNYIIYNKIIWKEKK